MYSVDHGLSEQKMVGKNDRHRLGLTIAARAPVQRASRTATGVHLQFDEHGFAVATSRTLKQPFFVAPFEARHHDPQERQLPTFSTGRFGRVRMKGHRLTVQPLSVDSEYYRRSRASPTNGLLSQKSPGNAEADRNHQRRRNSDNRGAQLIAFKPHP